MFAILTLGLLVVFVLLDGVLRVWIQRRRTGDTGIRRPSSPLQWSARLTFAAGILLTGLGAPAAELAGLPALPPLDHTAIRTAGIVLAVLAMLAGFAAQHAMGASWRTTADPTEHPALITSGVFGIVRNPIYTAAITATIGFALAVPNIVAVLGVLTTILGTHLQVRLVEEPYLRHIHHHAYLDYTARVGRFLPGIGRTTTLG